MWSMLGVENETYILGRKGKLMKPVIGFIVFANDHLVNQKGKEKCNRLLNSYSKAGG